MENNESNITTWELNVYDRNYEKYVFINTKDLQEDIHSSDPLIKKLFHKDVIDQFGRVLNSPYMNARAIPGVLIINGNTYGHVNGDIKAKLLYKCVPYDKSLPVFLIPYEYKCCTFSKIKNNKYVTFRIKEWVNKHPIGILTNTFGDVNDNESFYKYQLCCKGLDSSINGFNKAIGNSLKLVDREKLTEQIKLSGNLENRLTYEIFSIDPLGSKDIDDAMGISYYDNKVVISVYIANVALLLDHLDVWESFGKRISTIYLPNGKIPMLPNILSDDLCSLVQLEHRTAYCMDICIDENNNITTIFKRVIIRVNKNYAYEEESLINNPEYISLLKIVEKMNRTLKFVDTIVDSHNVVEFLMIYMNYEASKILLERKNGIFRVTNIVEKQSCVKQSSKEQTLPKHMAAIINNISGIYCTHENVKEHALIGKGLDNYTHITSPIRRIVDLCNLIVLQEKYMSKKAKTFAKKWMDSIDDINLIMKNIKRVQNNCNLLSLYSIEGSKKYTGLLFNKTIYKEDILKYSIYIPALNTISTIKTREKVDNYSNVVVSTHAFVNEDNIMKKIRFQLV
jgi:exoribonuclease R